MNNTYYTNDELVYLKEVALDIRKDILNMIYTANAGHPGSSLSTVEMIVALFYKVLRIDPQKPDWCERDRFILSKGHACPALYAVLARRGFFPIEVLSTLRKFHSMLQGHPDMNKVPGVDMTSGSLGNGLSIGLGMALSARLKKQKYITYVMLGDGECQEGMVWEAAMAASHHNVKNLVAIVDCNGLQINGRVDDVLRIEPFSEKWKAFGWDVIEVDGHNLQEILDVFHNIYDMKKPTVILAKTIKGKGVSFMENNFIWHSAVPTAEEYSKAINELVEVNNGNR